MNSVHLSFFRQDRGFDIYDASVLCLASGVMDWREDDFTVGFVSENPNATGSCGCGESFYGPTGESGSGQIHFFQWP